MKKYVSILCIVVFLSASPIGYTQVALSNSSNTETIEDLSIYPNPVSNSKIYISTKLNLNKEIEIFDVLGKKIYSTSLFGKELNISKLTPGIYILKIKENSSSATRKLVVR
jgi:hypothetical protein